MRLSISPEWNVSRPFHRLFRICSSRSCRSLLRRLISVRIETADKCGQQQLQDDASRHGRQPQDDVPVRLMGGGIYQVLAEPDEREGHADANCPGKNTRQNGGAISP